VALMLVRFHSSRRILDHSDLCFRVCLIQVFLEGSPHDRKHHPQAGQEVPGSKLRGCRRILAPPPTSRHFTTTQHTRRKL
jgi:hypothetical protein